jgi:hypothetical protein
LFSVFGSPFIIVPVPLTDSWISKVLVKSYFRLKRDCQTQPSLCSINLIFRLLFEHRIEVFEEDPYKKRRAVHNIGHNTIDGKFVAVNSDARLALLRKHFTETEEKKKALKMKQLSQVFYLKSIVLKSLFVFSSFFCRLKRLVKSLKLNVSKETKK